ncbi:unnamed protein product [Polarella glacialis]|uniref:Uncharacterized protein n=1 Tax=Polarella glacialis TaxID=89957 RepID=A0A813H8F0_POLGL|nr:unnamed protein product [Polarella glacialis]CAE8641908.1 unnamed protein product [Polarella glacialis]
MTCRWHGQNHQLLQLHFLLVLLMAGRCSGGVTGQDKQPFCPLGQCINCMHCNGACLDDCSCYSSINVCCCGAPPGHYSRGYEKVPCPGGSYQNVTGQWRCEPCNTSGQLYDITYRGSIDLLDCYEARCESRGASQANYSQWQAENCRNSTFVETTMMSHPPSEAFCSAMTPAIKSRGCSWNDKTGVGRTAGVSSSLLLAMAVLVVPVVPDYR